MLKKIGDGSKHEAIFVLVAGICLSFNSGYINGCCLSGLLSEKGSHRQAVSAFTGTYTKSGLALAEGQTSLFGFEISMILCFIFGAFISGLLNPKAVPRELGPSYGPTFLIGSVLMIISSVFSELDPEGKELFYFAAAANGLQNGMTSMYSANLIRTSHLTGTSTDIGLILGQMMRGNRKNAWKFCVLMGLASSFWLGGLLSFWAVTDIQNHTLIVSAALFLTIGLSHIVYIMVTQHVSIAQAALGTWQWDKALKKLSVLSRDGTPKTDEMILEVFDQIDTDGSGAITSSELQNALGGHGMRVDKRGIKAMMSTVDVKNDGVIDKEEFLALTDVVSLRAQRKSGKSRRATLARRHSSMNDPFAPPEEESKPKRRKAVSDLGAMCNPVSSPHSRPRRKRAISDSGARLNPLSSFFSITDIEEAEVDERVESTMRTSTSNEGLTALVEVMPSPKKIDNEAPDAPAAASSSSSQNTTEKQAHEDNSNIKQPETKEFFSVINASRQQQQHPQKLPSLPRTLEEATFNSVTDSRAIVVTEITRPFNIVSVNQAWENLCGYNASEAKGKTMKELVQGPKTDQAALENAMEGLIKGEQEVECIVVNYRKDRSMFWNRLKMGPLVEEADCHGNKAILYYVGILTEISALADDADGVSDIGTDSNSEDNFIDIIV